MEGIRFVISPPYHGGVNTYWYIYDKMDGKVIGTINQKGEIRAKKEMS